MQIGVPSTSTAFSVPGGISSTAATRTRSDTSANLLRDGVAQLADDLGERKPLQHVAEEAEHDKALRFAPRDAAAHDVEQLLLVELTDGGGVRAAHVVGLDFEVGQR